MRPRRGTTVALVGALALTLAACGGQSVTERLAEEAAEAAGGGDVDIDIDEDGGSISVESSEGSLEMGSGSLPASFPDDVPLPDGDYDVASSMEQRGDDGTEVNAGLLTTGDVDDHAAAMRQAFEDGGWDVVEDQRTTQGDLVSVTLAAEGDDHNVLLTITSDDEGEETLLNYLVAPAGAT